ncbi:MAG: MFS transporter [Promicromonosporaceae bacterium]|nr:MFS transporter [Promicromonosporaceae bacterium]
MMVQIAIIWHLARTGSAWTLTLGMVFAVGPQAIMSLFSGVLADRLPRKALIIGSDIAIAAASLTLAIILATGASALWLIFLVSAIRAVFAGLQRPAFLAVLPQIVPESELTRLNGIGETIGSVSLLAGPVIVGILMETVGLHAVMFVDVATAVIGIALLAAVKMPWIRPTTARPKFLAEFADGFRYLGRDKSARTLIFFSTGVEFFLSAPLLFASLLIVLRFGGETWMLSGMEMAQGVGALLGGAVFAALAAKLTRNRVSRMVISTIVAAGLAALIGVVGNVWLLIGANFGVSFLGMFRWIPQMTFLQESVPETELGRIMGIQEAVSWAAVPIAALLFGPLAENVSAGGVVAASGLMALTWAVLTSQRAAAKRALGGYQHEPITS